MLKKVGWCYSYSAAAPRLTPSLTVPQLVLSLLLAPFPLGFAESRGRERVDGQSPSLAMTGCSHGGKGDSITVKHSPEIHDGPSSSNAGALELKVERSDSGAGHPPKFKPSNCTHEQHRIWCRRDASLHSATYHLQIMTHCLPS